MKLLLTGPKRAGKTTLLASLRSELNPDFWILAHETRASGQRNGFAAVTSTDLHEPFAYRLSSHPGVVMGNYKVDLAAIDRLYSVPIRQLAHPGKLLLIDEIGRMQMLSPLFQSAIAELFKPEIDLIAVVPEPGDWTGDHFDYWVSDFTSRPDVVTLVLHTDNHEQIRRQILDQAAHR